MPNQTSPYVVPGGPRVIELGEEAPIEVRQDRATQFMVFFFAVLVTLIIIGLWVGQFAKQEPVRGYVSAEGGMTRLTAPQAGTVTEVFVNQGDTVTVGQRLATIKTQQVASDNATTLAIEQGGLKRRRDNNRAEITKIRELVEKLSTDRAIYIANQRQLLATIDAQEIELRAAKAQADEFVARLEGLVKSRDITRERLLSHQRAAQDYSVQIAQVVTRRTELVREHTQRMNTLEATLNDKSNQRAALENEIQAIETQLNQSEAQGIFHIVASTAGTVATVPVTPGASVEGGQLIIALGDAKADRVIILEAPAKSVGLLTEGQSVTVKYDAFPYKTFGIKRGTVLSVAQAPIDQLGPGSLTDHPMAARNESMARQTMYRILVKPDSNTISAYGLERPITLGSTLTADIIVERRRLIDWVIDPILALQGRN